MQSSIFGSPGLYSTLYSNYECRAPGLYSVLYSNYECRAPGLYSVLYSNYECRAPGLYSARYSNYECRAPGLYSVLYSNYECRALYSALQVYIQHYIQTTNVELYIRPSRSIFNTIFKLRMQSSRSIFSTIFKLRMQSSIFGPPGLYSTLYSNYECRAPGLYSVLYSNYECRALYSALLVYIQHDIQTTNVELYIRPSRSIFNTIFKLRMQSSRSIFSTIFKLRMQSSIFGSPGLYSTRYSNYECRALYSALQVYIQHYIQTQKEQLQVYIQYFIQTTNVELYIRLSWSIFNTIFKLRMQSSIFGSPGLYSTRYSNYECRALYSAPLVYIPHDIQTTNVELYIRLSWSIFNTIFKPRMQSSIFGSPGLYSTRYSNYECRALYSALLVYIQHDIQTPNVELYIRLSWSIFNTIFKLRMQSSIFGSPGLYSTQYSNYECRALFGSPGLYSTRYSNYECRALYSALLVYIQHDIQTPNVKLYIRLFRSMFSKIFHVRMQSSIFGPPGLYSELYSNSYMPYLTLIKSQRILPIWKPIPIRIFNLTEFSAHLKTHFMKK